MLIKLFFDVGRRHSVFFSIFWVSFKMLMRHPSGMAWPDLTCPRMTKVAKDHLDSLAACGQRFSRPDGLLVTSSVDSV